MLNVKHTAPQNVSTLTVLLTRKKGNAFFVKPLKNREGYYRVLGNVHLEGIAQVPTASGFVDIDAKDLPANIVLTEDEAMALSELPGNAYRVSGTFTARMTAGEEFEGSTIEGSLWLTPVGDMDLEPALATYVSAESVERAANAARERRAAYLAEKGSEAAVNVPVMD